MPSDTDEFAREESGLLRGVGATRFGRCQDHLFGFGLEGAQLHHVAVELAGVFADELVAFAKLFRGKGN